MIYKILIINFLLSVVIEGLIIFLLFKRKDYTYYSFLCNLLTNPAVNLLLIFLINICGTEYYYLFVILLEAAVVLIEAYVYRMLCDFKFPKALSVSLLLNSVSYLCGVLLYQTDILNNI